VRDVFPEYFTPTEKEFTELWNTATFAFDASSLLALYRTSEATRKLFLSVLRHFEPRLWLPHQAALEFLKNKAGVVHSQMRGYHQLNGMNDLLTKCKGDIESHKRDPLCNYEALAKALEVFSTAVSSSFTPSDEEIYRKNCAATDKELERLFAKRVGAQPSDIRAIEQQVKKRYDDLRPPGFLDLKGKEKALQAERENPTGAAMGNPFGDGIIWLELIEKATAGDFQSVIFVTEDKKADWWLLGPDSSNKSAPRPELRKEMQAAGANFYMYTVEGFVSYGSELLVSGEGKPTKAQILAATEELKSLPQSVDAKTITLEPSSIEAMQRAVKWINAASNPIYDFAGNLKLGDYTDYTNLLNNPFATLFEQRAFLKEASKRIWSEVRALAKTLKIDLDGKTSAAIMSAFVAKRVLDPGQAMEFRDLEISLLPLGDQMSAEHFEALRTRVDKMVAVLQNANHFGGLL